MMMASELLHNRPRAVLTHSQSKRWNLLCCSTVINSQQAGSRSRVMRDCDVYSIACSLSARDDCGVASDVCACSQCPGAGARVKKGVGARN